MKLAEVSQGVVYVDTNVLYMYLRADPLHLAAIELFLKRVVRGEIAAYVSLFVVDELYYRLLLALGVDVGPQGEALHFPGILFVIVPATWLVMFTFAGVYDSRRTMRAVDDLQTVAQATVVATLVFAGIAYFLEYI